MNTTTLDPTVAQKLQRFGKRRFRMLVVRGLCAAVVTFLLCICVVAVVDWYWILTDTARWCLSGAAYLLTAIVVWATSLRQLSTPPLQKELAAHVENAEPELRENLLSAVELAIDDPSSVHDSPVFRGLLQGKVATQMAKVRVPNLLPLRLLGRWLLSAAGLILVLASLMSLPDARFRTLAARAMLPGANIDRVSRIHVDILQPTPSSITIAKDETVAVVVKVSGGNVGEVILETFTADGAQRQSMRSRTDAEFAANVHVTDDSIQYRILAGDAVTKRHTIIAKGRPQVVAFQKTFQFPEYADLPNRTVSETDGDLIALQGTMASLELELDQQVSVAELRIDGTSSEDVLTIPLTQNGHGRWSADVSVDEAAIYKVHLISSETGFENVFSPRYEIQPLPDLVPRAGFVDQQETNLLLPPNDILALKGMAEDDLPLVSLQQEISVNGREWVAVSLDVKSVLQESDEDSDTIFGFDKKHRLTSDWTWDLLDLKLKTGDQITTRLVATDKKGNRGESVPLRIVVSAPDFDPDRHVQTEAKAVIYDRLNDLATTTAEHRTTAGEIIKRLKEERGRPAEEQRTTEEIALDRTNLRELADEIREASGVLLAEIQTTTRSMPSGADAYDLELVGRLISRLHHEYSQKPNHFLTAIQRSEDEKLIRNHLDQLKQSFDRMADDSKNSAYHFQHLISHDLGAAVALDFDALLRQQQLVIDSPTQSWDRLVRQETVVANQLLVVERLVRQQRHRLQGHLQNQFGQLMDWSRQRIEQLERAMESEDKLNELQQLSKTLHRELSERQRIEVADGGLAERLNQSRREFDHRSGTLSEPLVHIANATRDENRILADARIAEDSTKAAELTKQAERFMAEVELRHDPTLNQLRTRRTLVQARPDADPQFAADAGLTQRAFTSLLNQHRRTDPQESIVPAAFAEIAPAYRILEAGYDLKNVQLCLDNLIQLEQWNSQNLTGKTDHPRQWDVVAKGFEEAINKLRAARVDNEVMARLDEVRRAPPAREAGRKLSKRRWQRDDLIGASFDLRELRDLMRPPGDEIEAVMAEARAVIAKYAPTIPQMAQQAADQLRQLEQETTEVADAVEEADQQQEPPTERQQTPDNKERQFADLQQQQDRINQQLDDLIEALIEDANSQNVVDEEQRERARDADDSIAMVQEPAKRMNEALAKAVETSEAKPQAQELAKAAEQQERTAQALERVAEHFDRLEQGLDVAESREELRQQEREMGIARQMDQRYESAEELAEMAQQAPEDLMQQLELQLAENPAMREALSEISQKAVQEAKNALLDAAEREQEFQRANERSDAQLLQQKRELTKDLRELGTDAANLSQQLVAQARTAASQAKTPEAQREFEQTQQNLNSAASSARSANENELQKDLAAKAKTTQDAIKQATEALLKAKQQSEAALDEEIHAKESDRQNARKSLESQRKRFNDQRKKVADSETKQKQRVEQQAKTNLQNTERNLKKTEQQLQQAQKQLKTKPDDRGRERNVKQAESRVQQAQGKVDTAKQKHQQAQEEKDEAHDARNRMNEIPQPSLDAKNPAAQLAELFAQEAIKPAEELRQRAEELVNRSKATETPLPSENQLTATAVQQQRLTDNVDETAENVARAARHERRLESPAAAQVLQQAADDIEQVAEGEATVAQQRLVDAAEASRLARESEQPNARGREQGEAANSALADSEQALAVQAAALAEVMAAMQQTAAAGEESSGEQASGQQQAAAQQSDGGQQVANGQQSGGQPPEGGVPSESVTVSSAQQPFTSEEMDQGRDLARTLDELDRQQAAQLQAQTQSASDSATQAAAAQRSLSNLAQAARSQQAQMAAARTRAQQQAALSGNPSSQPPEGEPEYDGQSDAFTVLPINRDEENEWGKLREQAAEDLTKGRREKVSEEYRKSVETYFRVLAERARRNK